MQEPQLELEWELRLCLPRIFARISSLRVCVCVCECVCVLACHGVLQHVYGLDEEEGGLSYFCLRLCRSRKCNPHKLLLKYFIIVMKRTKIHLFFASWKPSFYLCSTCVCVGVCLCVCEHSVPVRATVCVIDNEMGFGYAIWSCHGTASELLIRLVLLFLASPLSASFTPRKNTYVEA